MNADLLFVAVLLLVYAVAALIVIRGVSWLALFDAWIEDLAAQFREKAQRHSDVRLARAAIWWLSQRGELKPLPYAREAVELWHEYGLTLEYLEGMSYNHRVQLVEAANRYTKLTEGLR